MRHKKAEKREVQLDKIYNSTLVTKVVNTLMKDGKKTAAEKLVYGAFDIISQKGHDPLSIFEKALQNVGPRFEVKPRRVGGASYQVPVEVKGDRKTSLAIRWITQTARSKSNKEYHTFAEKLAAEFLDASNNLGEAIKKRDAVHRMAEANKAFSHFRW